MLELSPIFEADLQTEQYAYRVQRSANDAVLRVHSFLNTGHHEVVDADLSNYFDEIPHAELMKSVARRVSNGWILGLIKSRLVMPVQEDDGKDGKRRLTHRRLLKHIYDHNPQTDYNKLSISGNIFRITGSCLLKKISAILNLKFQI